MQLRLSDPGLTDRLATFLTSLGQAVRVAAPGAIEIELAPTSSARSELEIYLRVWSVLYPDTDVQVVNGEDEPPSDVA
jgi:hypothetical protein